MSGLPVAVVYAYTGFVLEWDQLSFHLAQSLLDLVLSIPVAGEFVAGVLFGGQTLGQEPLVRAFVVHYALVVFATLVALGAARTVAAV